MMQKFWVLSAINTITKSPQYVTNVQNVVDGDKYRVKLGHAALMNLLSASNRFPNGDHIVFGQSIIANKFALIYVNF